MPSSARFLFSLSSSRQSRKNSWKLRLNKRMMRAGDASRRFEPTTSKLVAIYNPQDLGLGYVKKSYLKILGPINVIVVCLSKWFEHLGR